jgi:Domain of unknown function (DUF1905)
MQYIIKNEKLIIQYIQGNGAWTYQLIIPNTKNIKGKWGDLKVSGTIDAFEIKNKNLGPMKNADKKMALNAEIRNAIGKSAGDIVSVTLYLQNKNDTTTNDIIFDCFKDAEVLDFFKTLQVAAQNEIIKTINAVATEQQKVEKIIHVIAQLNQQKVK